MKKTFTLLTTVIIITFSCTEDQTTPTCSDHPADELTWMKEDIEAYKSNHPEDVKYFYITQTEHDGAIIFIYGNCDPLVNYEPQVFDCEGKSAQVPDEVVTQSLANENHVIWKSEDSACFSENTGT